MKEKESASGISPEMLEQDQLLEEIVAMETEGEITNDANVDEKRKAQDMRKKAMENNASINAVIALDYIWNLKSFSQQIHIL